MPHLRCRIQVESSLQPFVFVFGVTNGQERTLVQIVLHPSGAGSGVSAAPSLIDSKCLRRVSQMRGSPRNCDGNHDAGVMLANIRPPTTLFVDQKSVSRRAF